MHALQFTFAAAEGEAAWCDALRSRIEGGELDAAEAMLKDELTTLDGDVARLCLAARRDSVVLTGWSELAEAIALHEGEPVTGVTLAIANEPDLAFEKGAQHRPFLMLGIYTDEQFDWSRASRAELLAECQSEDPAWAGHDEDIEVFLEIEGLEAINTALLHHKQRFFIREGDPDHAPLRYVDFVLGCWWRALRFHQAIATEYALNPLPGAVPVVAGMVELRPEVVSVHYPAGRFEALPDATEVILRAAEAGAEAGAEQVAPVPEFAALGFVPRKQAEVVEEFYGAHLRKRFAESVPDEPEARPGFFARLFGKR